jgi:hypothetical protein
MPKRKSVGFLARSRRVERRRSRNDPGSASSVADASNGNPFGEDGIRILTPSNVFYSSQSHCSSDAILPPVDNSPIPPYQNRPRYSESDSDLLPRSASHIYSKGGFVISPPAPLEHVLNHSSEVILVILLIT